MIGKQHRRMRALTDPVIQTSQRVLPQATEGQPYVFQLTAVGVLPNEIATWVTVYGTALPAGLTLSADGLISGIPTAPAVGTHTFALDVHHEPA